MGKSEPETPIFDGKNPWVFPSHQSIDFPPQTNQKDGHDETL